MIVAQFIKAVRVGRNYNIKIEFNVTFDQFLSYCVDAEQAKERPGHVRNLHKKVQENCKIMHFLNYSGGKILQCLTINGPADEAIQTEKEILLVFAETIPNFV